MYVCMYVCMYLICMYCVAGPGEELKIDDEVFITKLRQLLDNLPSSFPHWHLVLGTHIYNTFDMLSTYIVYILRYSIHTYIHVHLLFKNHIYVIHEYLFIHTHTYIHTKVHTLTVHTYFHTSIVHSHTYTYSIHIHTPLSCSCSVECLDICLLQRREERVYIAQAFVRMLFLHALQLSGGGGEAAAEAATVLAMVQAIGTHTYIHTYIHTCNHYIHSFIHTYICLLYTCFVHIHIHIRAYIHTCCSRIIFT